MKQSAEAVEVKYSFRKSPWPAPVGVRMNLSLEVDGVPSGTWASVTMSDDSLDGRRLAPDEMEAVIQSWASEPAQVAARETIRRLHATYARRAS